MLIRVHGKDVDERIASEYLLIGEVMKALKLNKAKVQQLLVNGVLRAIRLCRNGRIWIYAKDVEDYRKHRLCLEDREPLPCPYPDFDEYCR